MLLIRRKSGECDVLCYGNSDTLWMVRHPSADVMFETLESLSDIADFRVKEFAERRIYPDHVAGAINDINLTEAELRAAGFSPYRRGN